MDTVFNYVFILFFAWCFAQIRQKWAAIVLALLILWLAFHV